MTRYRLILAALLLSVVQIGFLGWIIASRAAILRDGREVTVKVEPVDPRDLLRGDYVRLGYEMSNIPVKLIGNVPTGATETAGGAIYVRLKKDADGYWRAASASLDTPSDTPLGPDEADIRGEVSVGWSLAVETSLGVDYGIERFYLPEGEGLAIEQDMRVRPFGVRLALGSDGTPQIKALLDGDKTLFEEPLY